MWKGIEVSLAIAVVLAAPQVAAQTYSKTEAITYSDNLSLWVIGQVAKTTCVSAVPAFPACDGQADSVVSETVYDATWAVPTQTKSFGKLVQTLAYDATSAVSTGQRGTVKSVADGAGNVTTVTGWKRGIPQQITYPATPDQTAPVSRSAVVNDDGTIASVTDENGSKTCYEYDAMGRVRETTYSSETSAGACDANTWSATTQTFVPVATAEYGIAGGHWRQVVSTGNARKDSYFDALWRPLLVREYDAANIAGTERFTRFVYDHEGRVTFAAYPSTTSNAATGVWTEYDALGRVTSVAQDSEQGLLITKTEYLLGFIRKTTNPRGVATTERFQVFDQPSYDAPVQIDVAAGTADAMRTTIVRDVFGKPLSITRGPGN